MRHFSLYQYKEMAERFNKKSFKQKILTINDNSDILTLVSYHNCWYVKVKDEEIQKQLEESKCEFNIDNYEMCELLNLLGFCKTDV